jgi:hypothetical protein
MSTEVDFRPPIFQSIEIHGQVYLKLSEAAAEEHIPVNTFAERLLSEGLSNRRIFQTTWPRPVEKR